MRLPHPKHATVVAYLALFTALSGSAYAATGGTFLLGRSNSAGATTTLTDAAGTPLALNAKAGSPPLAVNSTKKVGKLNADLLDSLDSAALQRRVTGTCAVGSFVRAVAATGTVTCEDQKAAIAQVRGPIVTDGGQYEGQGLVSCPAGGAISGGGFSTGNGAAPPAPAFVQLSTALSYTDATTKKRINTYFVILTNADGTPYHGGGTVFAECPRGVSFDYTPPATPAMQTRSQSAPTWALHAAQAFRAAHPSA